MTPAIVNISAPARLHFGLLSFKRAVGPDYGGIGLMLRSPRTELQVTAARGLSASGPSAERAIEFARRWAERTGQPANAKISVIRAIPAHAGLGSGTQLGLAIAEGLSRLSGNRSAFSLAEMARSVQRANRSSVGTYGFAQGGLIAEMGQEKNEPLGRLECRLKVPEAWRIVLVRAAWKPGLSGVAESSAFAELPPVPVETTAALTAIMKRVLLPAIAEGDFDGFSQSIYEYGFTAGRCFEPIQGGPFAGRTVAKLVSTIRAFGIQGVGQSSWGPTVFAFARNDVDAAGLSHYLTNSLNDVSLDIQVTAGDNDGAIITECTE